MVIALGALALAVRALRHPEDREKLLRAACLGFITFVAYLVPTLVGLGNPFFGAEFQVLLVLGAVMVMRMFAVNAQAWGLGVAGQLPLVGAVLAALLLSRGFPPRDWAGRQGRDYNVVVRNVADLVYDKAPPEARVFLTGTGWVNSDTLQYLSRRRGKKFVFTDAPFSDDVSDQIHGFDGAEFVLAAESGVGEFNTWTPSSKVFDQSLAALRARTDFHEVGSVRSETGRWFYLFGQTPKFIGFEQARNVSEEEGPYPDWHLPIVRWSYYPDASIHFVAPAPGTYRLSADGRTPVGGQVLTVTVDGREVGIHKFEKVMTFEQFDMRFDVPPGDHELVLHFSAFAPSPFDTRRWGVLFKRLQLLAPEHPGATTKPATDH
jgi:hypothetical protein